MRAPNPSSVGLAIPFFTPGGDDRIRTGDPLLAKQVLSRLSYIPSRVVGLGRVELPTSRLSGARSQPPEL
jgi:hypothetical protein